MGLFGLRPVQAVTTHTVQTADGKGREGIRPLSLGPQVLNWWEAKRGDSFTQRNYLPWKGTCGIAPFLTESSNGSTWNLHRSHSLPHNCSHLPAEFRGQVWVTGSCPVLLQLLALFLLACLFRPGTISPEFDSGSLNPETKQACTT